MISLEKISFLSPLHIPNMAFVVVDGFFHFAQQHGGGLQLMVVDHVEGLAAMGGTMGKVMKDLGFEVIRRHSSRFCVVKERHVTDNSNFAQHGRFL